MESNEIIPKYLYRGIVIDYSDLRGLKLAGVDMKLPYEPYIDEKGRKTVHDENEYGIYMSDNLSMVESAYGRSHKNGTYLSKDIYLGSCDKKYIATPNVELIYEISTQNLDIRKPWIRSELQSVYNNGFIGNEWITDKIPPENYKVLSMYIYQRIYYMIEKKLIVQMKVMY